MTKFFWTIAILDAIAALVLWRQFLKGPHGQFDGLVLFAFYLLVGSVALTACLFPLFKSEGWRIATLIVFALLSTPLILGSATSVVKNVQTNRQSSGSAYFSGAAYELAQAMQRHDVATVKQLIPKAGDLNKPQDNGTSLWQFAVRQCQNNEESFEMLRTLIAAGADPKRDTSAETLLHAIAQGPELTRLLLEAGSNPNLFDSEQRPVWWRTLQAGEDDNSNALLKLMLQHGADLQRRALNQRGPVAHCVANGYWFAAAQLIERGAEWKDEVVHSESIPVLFEWEILRREDYPLPIPVELRKVLALMKGQSLEIPAEGVREAGDVRIIDLLRDTSHAHLEKTKAGLEKVAQRPDWVRRVVAFLGERDSTRRNQVALLLSLKPESLPEDVQERCWTVLREQVAWYDQTLKSSPREPHGWLLKETAVIAAGLASIPGPVRERHQADVIGLKNRIEACRRAKDPEASNLVELR